MQRYSLFGRQCRDACVHLYKVLHYLQEREGIHRSLTATGILVSMFTAVSITASPGTDWIVSTQNADACYVTSIDIKYGLLTTPHFMSRPPSVNLTGNLSIVLATLAGERSC
jgi:hypothetical protein